MGISTYGLTARCHRPLGQRNICLVVLVRIELTFSAYETGRFTMNRRARLKLHWGA